MRIDKIINGIQKKQSFKGYHHEINDLGDRVMKFYYPHDPKEKNVELQIFKVKDAPEFMTGKIADGEEPIYRTPLSESGTVVNLRNIPDFNDKDYFIYRVSVNGNYVPETGLRINDKDILVTQKGPKPIHAGKKAVLAMSDTHAPGASYHGYESNITGKTYFDEHIQRVAENKIRTYSNKLGGNLAGIDRDIPELKKLGYDVLYATPIAGADNVTYHGYWNKNNKQISPHVGNMENYTTFVQTLFANNMKYVFDGTFTSEGFEGVNFQRALICGDTDPLTRDMFTISDSIKFGVIPFNKDVFRIKFENSPVSWEQDENGNIKIWDNPHYDKDKETYWQSYDVQNEDDKLGVNTYQDTAIKYKFEILNPDEVRENLERLKEYNKTAPKPIMIDSAEGAEYLSQFSHFGVGQESIGIFQWDDQAGMAKRRHEMSEYDDKRLEQIDRESKRAYRRKWMEAATYANQDSDFQDTRYWTGKTKDIITMYTARTLQKTSSVEDIEKLIQIDKLPEKARLTANALANIKNGWYKLEPKGVLEKDDVTIKSLMKLPLQSLEFGENTVSVLASPFLTNYATSEETLGLTKFELYKKENPHLFEPYAISYLKMEQLYTNQLKDFADEVINALNEQSEEKLLNQFGDYTEYGEYVIELIGSHIAKYAFLKSVAGDKLETKVDRKGTVHYNYPKLREETTLRALGIRSTNAQIRANELREIIQDGLNKLNANDVNYLANAFLTQLKGTDVNSFRIAEAMYNKSSLGLDWRLDAIKDGVDMDAVRNRDKTFDSAVQRLTKYCSKLIESIEKENPNSNITAEITDFDALMRATIGNHINVGDDYNLLKDAGLEYKSQKDVMTKLFNETGMTEAGYSYFFTNVITALSKHFENGRDTGSLYNIRDGLRNLIENRSLDYIKGLMTFIGNHDKARVIHSFSLNLGEYFGDFSPYDGSGNFNHKQNIHMREGAMMRLFGVDAVKDMPLEIRLNIDNADYFKTISPQALAMANLINDSLNQSAAGLATPEEMSYLKRALADLMDGKFLGNGNNISRTTINLPELSNLNDAFKKIIEIAKEKHGLNISDEDANNLINSVVDCANSDSKVYNHLVAGDFYNGEIAKNNRAKAADVLKGDMNAEISENEIAEASLYTICLAALLKDAFLTTNGNYHSKNAILESIKDFAKTYNRNKVSENSSEFPYAESAKNAMRKFGFAVKEIDTNIMMLVEQAEYLARKDGKLGKDEHFVNAEEIEKLVYQSAIEPGIQKAGIAFSILSALPGVATIFDGDDLGATGGEEMTKNPHAQCRNTRKILQLKEGIFKEFRNRIQKHINACFDIRSREGMDVLYEGTPYILNTSDDSNFLAVLYQKGARYAISVINVQDIMHDARINYFEKFGINNENKEEYFGENSWNAIKSINPNNPYVPIQGAKFLDYIELPWNLSLPDNLEFFNTMDNAKEKYILKHITENGRKVYRLFRDNAKFVINGNTARNNVMILKTAFRGRNLNQKYNIPSNYTTYTSQPVEIKGEKLSLLSK